MSFTNGDLSAADVAAVVGNGGNGFGGFNGDGAYWMLILFLFAMMGGWNNNGNGFGGGNGGGGAVIPAVQAGFDQAAIVSQLSGINTAISNGFANAEVSRCNSQMNLMQTLNANQMGLTNQLNTIAMNQQNCCCENRAATADLKYTIANEAAATRANDQANTQAIMDKLCQLELDGVKQNYETRIAGMQAQIDGLSTALNAANTNSMVNGAVSRVLSDNAAQTVALEQYLNPTPIPAYTVQNPNCCSPNTGCGCGSF